MSELSTKYLIESGVHFGHPTQKWNPNFKKFIAGQKNGIHIIDVNKTIENLNIALKELTKIVSNGGNVLFVGTKKQAKEVVQESADKCGMFYVNERWLGGTLTNFSTIKRSINRLKVLEKESSDVIEKEKEIYRDQALQSGKPENIVEKMIEGRLNKFYQENVLLEQNFVKDPDKVISDLLSDTISTLGENIEIKRFSRFQLGELSKPEDKS